MRHPGDVIVEVNREPKISWRKVKNRARGQFRSVLCPTKRDRSRCRGLSPYSPGGTTGG